MDQGPRRCHTINVLIVINSESLQKPYLGKEVLLKAQAQGKARENLEGNLLALLHKSLHEAANYKNLRNSEVPPGKLGSISSLRYVADQAVR